MELPPAPPPRGAHDPIDRSVPDALRAGGGPGLPRWPLLSALFVIVVMSADYALAFAPPSVGLPWASELSDARWPAEVTLSVAWALFAAGWIAAWCWGAPVQEPRGRRGPVPAFLRQVSDFEALRELVLGAGAAALGLGVAMLATHRAQPVAVALASITAFVGLWTWRRRRPEPEAPASAAAGLDEALARADSPWSRLRSLPRALGRRPRRPPPAAGPGR